MSKVAQKPSFEVEEARTLIRVSHLGKNLTFAHPAKGHGTYNSVAEQIDKDKTPSQLYKPTTSQTISLNYEAFQEQDNELAQKYAQQVIDILKDNYKFFWCFTKNLWTPEGHVFVVNDIDGSKLNRKDLEARLGSREEDGVVYSDDGIVRFVQKDKVRLGEQTIGQLEENGYIRAHAEGYENAQKLAEIAGEFKLEPYVFGLKDVAQDTETKTGLGVDWYWVRLGFVGDFLGGGRDGYAFGVQK